MRVRLAALCLLCFAVSVGPLPAEVGVVVQYDRTNPDGDAVGAPYLQGIVDLPDPINIWRRDSPTTDTRRVVLNEGGEANGDGSPAMLFHPGLQRAYVFWSRNLGTGVGYKIVYSYFSAGTWSAPRRINVTDGQQLDPQVTVAADGTIYIAFWETLGEASRVWLQSVNDAGDSWTQPAPVSQLGVTAGRPSLAMHAGQLRLTFEVYPNGAGTTLKEVVVSALENGSYVEQIIASSNHSAPLWPRVHSTSGELWVDWIDFAVTEYQGDMAWLSETGTGWSSIDYRTFDSQQELEYNVRGVIELDVVNASSGTTQEANQTPQGTP